MSTPSWVSSYKAPPEDQWIADPRTGAMLSGATGSTSTVPSSAPRHSDSQLLDLEHKIVNRFSTAPVATFSENKVQDSKYDSIAKLQRSQKVDALKDTKLNPFALKDPYDTLAHNFYLWTQVARNATANPHITGAQQEQIASNFYDKMLAPAYGGLKIAPMDKKLWMQQAWGEALNYNIEDAYNNSLVHNLKDGLNSGLAATARAYGRVTDMLGNEVDDAIALWRSGKFGQVLGDAAAGRPAWYQTISQIASQVKAKRATEQPNMVERGAVIQSAKRQFWADALPTQDGFWNHVTSMTAEGIGQAPIFAAMSLGNEGAGAVGLTDILKASPLGARLSGYLLAGTEGLAYGAATHKQDDPGDTLRDAIGFAVFHGLFDVGGLGLKKLTDIAPESWRQRLGAYSEKLDMAQNGQRPATPVEQYEMHTKEVANNIVATGQLGQRAIFVDALHHIEELEKNQIGRSRAREIEANLLKEDPERWGPALSAAKFVRSLLGDQKLSEMKEGSPEEKFLGERIAQLIVDAGERINSNAIGLDKVNEEKAASTLSQSGAKHTLQYYEKKVAEELQASGAAGLVKPEQVQQYAAKMYAEDLQKAAEEAQKAVVEKPVEKATNAAKRRTSENELPAKLRGSKPRYGYGNKLFELKFEDPRDLAAYTVAQETKNKAHDEFLEYLSNHFSSDTEAQMHGRAVRAFIKNLAKDADPEEGPLTIPSQMPKERGVKIAPGMKIRSEHTTNKYGEPAARYQIVPDYKVRLKAHIAAAKAKGVSMAKYFQDLDDQDFVNDLSTYFYPKELRTAKIFFEHQNTREGMQNPNFLAFMYNYLDKMPAEFGRELENRLTDTVKVQRYMNGKTPTEPQLLYYAKAMYNHVDNFLGSGRWPEESNLFRTSNETMFKTTEWQRQLLIEKQLQEQANLKDMFSGDAKAKRAALTAHAAFSKLRLNEFDKASPKRGSQDIIHAYDELIADLQTESKAAKAAGYKRWKF